jgi:Domain of unknown function (DUF6468)
MIALATDLLLAFLLVLTASWCVLLYRRLDRLRVDRGDIEAFVTAIDAAVRRAEQAIAGIRDGAAVAQRVLDAEQATSQQRVAELTRLIDSAGRMAHRVEAAVHHGARAMASDSLSRDVQRRQEPDQAPPAAETESPAARGPRPGRPRLNAELLRVLEALR